MVVVPHLSGQEYETQQDRIKGYNVGWFKWSFIFVFLKLLRICSVVAIFDLVQHDVQAIFHLS